MKHDADFWTGQVDAPKYARLSRLTMIPGTVAFSIFIEVLASAQSFPDKSSTAIASEKDGINNAIKMETILR